VESIQADKIRVPALTGIRFVAALMVLLGHGYPVVQFGDTQMIGKVLGPLAGCAMTLFFVLSGFVIQLNYAGIFQRHRLGIAVRSFATARFARLYPLFACVLVLSIATTDWTKLAASYPESLLFIPLLQAWVPGRGSLPLTHSIWEAAHTWSISVEWFFYLLFPLVVLLVPRIRTTRSFAGLLIVMLMISFTATWLFASHTNGFASRLAPGLPISEGAWWVIYYSPYSHLIAFVLGVLSAEAFLRIRDRQPTARESHWTCKAGTAAIAVLIVCIYSGAVAPINPKGIIDGTVDPFRFALARTFLTVSVAFLVFFVARHESWLRRVLSLPLIVLGGEISYSIYLLHPFTLKLFVQPALPTVSAQGLVAWVLVLLAAIIATLVVSWTTYALVEVPGRRWLRRLASDQNV